LTDGGDKTEDSGGATRTGARRSRINAARRS